MLTVQLLADFNPSFADQTSGGLPFFRDDGELTLPAQSQAEMEESMPELQLFSAQPTVTACGPAQSPAAWLSRVSLHTRRESMMGCSEPALMILHCGYT